MDDHRIQYVDVKEPAGLDHLFKGFLIPLGWRQVPARVVVDYNYLRGTVKDGTFEGTGPAECRGSPASDANDPGVEYLQADVQGDDQNMLLLLVADAPGDPGGIPGIFNYGMLRDLDLGMVVPIPDERPAVIILGICWCLHIYLGVLGKGKITAFAS
jgi:hypothetical protein